MKRAQSIRARLSLLFLFMFLLVIVLGLESLRSLADVNDASAQIRVRWLPSTRALGDLNNLTTDFPAALSSYARAQGVAERADIVRSIAEHDLGIAAAMSAYAQIRHDPVEDALYARFSADWRRYRTQGGGFGGSSDAYRAASETLGKLTDRNLASAREASERSERAYGQARNRIVITICLAGMFVAGATLQVARSISAPLVDLASRMHRLAADETSLEIAGTRRHDEIGEMARAVVVFRNNAIDLADKRRALAEQASVLEEKLAEEQRVTLLQRNFVAMASHEFRTPLAIIDGHAQRLISMRGRLTGDELADRASRMRNAVRRMTQLIENLIGSARLIDGRMGLPYQPKALDVNGLIREVCDLQRELTPDAEIVDYLDAQPLMIRGDRALLCQMFGNLLSNAIKYSPDGGLIEIKALKKSRHIVVIIEDHGMGIPDNDRNHVFEPYYRGSNTSGIVGSGVGLYLVRTIVDLHEGSITMETRESGGTRFAVKLPGDEHPRESADAA